MRIIVLLFLGACGGAQAATGSSVTITPAPVTSTTAQADPVATGAPTTTATSNKRPTELSGTAIRFVGGDGSSTDEAILIRGAQGEMDGTGSEYRYLAMVYGPQNSAWTLSRQSLMSKNGKHYDAMAITLADGTSKTVYFDISEYFGKF
jgi:hypothetical protein